MSRTTPHRFAAVAVAFFILVGCATVPAPPAASPAAVAAGEAPRGPAPTGAGAPKATPGPLPDGASFSPLSPTRQEPEPIREEARVVLGAVGDVLMHEAVKQSAAVHGAGQPDAGYSFLFAPIADLLSEPDVTFANLETPIAPRASRGSHAFVFNAPPEVISALEHAGIHLVSAANNHALDQGRKGFEETLAELDAAGMPYLGAGPAPHPEGPLYLERNGLRLAFLGYTYGLNQPGNDCPPRSPGAAVCLQAAELDRTKALVAVRAAAEKSDAVVVSLHWGIEYEQAPREADVEFAHRLADAGALLVLGHHPHVLQPLELYRRADGRTALIAYSLGNFVSNQSRNYVPGVTPDAVAATRDGVLLRAVLARRNYGRGVARVELVAADFLPLWTENDSVEIDPKREPSRRPTIRVVAVERALFEVRAELLALKDPLPKADEDRFVELRQKEALYLSRRSAVAALLGEDLVRTLTPRELAPKTAAQSAEVH